MYSVLYKKNKHTKFHGNRYNSFRDTAITNSRSPAKFVRGAPVLQLAPASHQAPYAVILHAVSKYNQAFNFVLRNVCLVWRKKWRQLRAN